jgi:hypothetical protein
MIRAAVAGLLLLLLGAGPAVAQTDAPRVPVRVGDHPGFGRIVFDWPQPTDYRVAVEAGTARVSFASPGVPDLQSFRAPPRNVSAISGTGGTVEVRLAQGAEVRHFRIDNRIVVDILDPRQPGATAQPDPAPRPAAPPAAAPAPAPASAPRVVALPLPAPPTPTPPPLPARQAQPGAGPVQAGATPPAAPSGPAQGQGAAARAPATAGASAPPATGPATNAAGRPAAGQPTPSGPPTGIAQPAPAPLTRQPPNVPVVVLPDQRSIPVRVLAPPGQPRALAVAVPPGTGAASFRRGDWLFAVFDVEQTLDLDDLRGDPVFGNAATTTIAGATILRLPIAEPAVLGMRRSGRDWVIEPRRTPPASRTMTLEPDAGPPIRLAIRATEPGQVVPMTDPETELPLLVATVADAGQSVAVSRRMMQADVLPTSLGAAILVRDDRLRLTRGLDRFLLATEAGDDGLRIHAGSFGALSNAAAMSRLFDLPNAPIADLQAILREQQAALADAPPLQRAPGRRALAQTMLSLGLGHEAQAMTRLAMQEDPRAGADPVFGALAGAAAALADRPEEANGLADPRLALSDELVLWRAVAAARRGQPAAAGGFATSLPLLLAYPQPLLARLAPLAALSLAEAGEAAPLQALIASAPETPALDLARGRLAEVEGRTQAALAEYDLAALGRDRLVRARALRYAIELRLATGEITVGQAAAALDAALFAWRGEAEELANRIRLAELRHQAGASRAAFDLLRETEVMFPTEAGRIRSAAGQALVAALQTESPLSAVALHDANRALLASEARQDAIALLLADRLVALDLPARADIVLTEALAIASGEARARIGLRMAEIRLAEGDAGRALEALSASSVTEAPAEIQERRALVGALALARRGDLGGAIAALEALGPAGHVARVRLLAEERRWADAADALAAHLASAPAAGPLPEPLAQEAVRLAAFAALAGQDDRLAALRVRFAGRLPQGPLSTAFDLLSADAMSGVADLPRLARELEILRDLPGLLEPLRAQAPRAR